MMNLEKLEKSMIFPTRASCLNYKTEELCNNLYLQDKRKIERKMHAIITFRALRILNAVFKHKK